MEGETPYARQVRREMEELGPAQVRAMISGGIWPAGTIAMALAWLAELGAEAERAARAEREQSQGLGKIQEAKDIKIAASDKKRDSRLIWLAVAGVIIALLAWWFPRH